MPSGVWVLRWFPNEGITLFDRAPADRQDGRHAAEHVRGGSGTQLNKTNLDACVSTSLYQLALGRICAISANIKVAFGQVYSACDQCLV